MGEQIPRDFRGVDTNTKKISRRSFIFDGVLAGVALATGVKLLKNKGENKKEVETTPETNELIMQMVGRTEINLNYIQDNLPGDTSFIDLRDRTKSNLKIVNDFNDMIKNKQFSDIPFDELTEIDNKVALDKLHLENWKRDNVNI